MRHLLLFLRLLLRPMRSDHEHDHNPHPATNSYLLREIERILHREKLIMAALDDLKANVAKLSADVDALLAKPAGVPEAEVQAQADAVAAVDAKVVAAT